jgi:peptidoglycan/LPS O-acetylase OafA/YrhL
VAGQTQLRWLMPFWIAVGITLSLLHFNLDSEWDNWAPYFLGSYGLGLMAWWASDPRRRPGAVALMLVMVLLPTLTGLLVDFRSRIALALAVACALLLFGRTRTSSQGRVWSAINGLAKISYAVFLIHFPVCLLVNAAFTRFVPAVPEAQAAGMLIAWAASLAAGAVFHRWVEAPLGRVFEIAAGRTAIRPTSA